MTLSDLIARLERAECGSRELDALIGIAVDFRHAQRGLPIQLAEFVAEFGEEAAVAVVQDRISAWSRIVPSFTTSIDAAITLIPEGLAPFFNMGHRFGTDRTLKECFAGFETVSAPYHFGALAKTFPLAICTAALKAIRYQTEESKS